MSGWTALERLLDAAPGEWSASVRLLDGTPVFEYAADVVRPSASLIKVPLAMALVTSDIDLDAVETLYEEDRVEGEGLFDAAPALTRRSRRELIGHMLRESDNTAGNLLIRALGMDAANRLLHEPPLDLKATCLGRRFMDFAAAAAGHDNLTSAREMCRLFMLLATAPVYAPLLDMLTQSPYDERLVAGVPAGTIVAHKVGDLDGVEHDVGIVYVPRAPYIVALLSAGLPELGDGTRVIADASRLIYSLFVTSDGSRGEPNGE